MKRVDEKLTRRAFAALFVSVVSNTQQPTLPKRLGNGLLLLCTALKSYQARSSTFRSGIREFRLQKRRFCSTNLSFLFPISVQVVAREH